MEGLTDGGTEGRRDGGTEGRRDGGTEGRRAVLPPPCPAPLADEYSGSGVSGWRDDGGLEVWLLVCSDPHLGNRTRRFHRKHLF